MNTIFYIAALFALLTTILAVTRKNAIHALLFLILSLLSISIIFYILGAPFIAALEVIVYAGAIMVLFIFVIMMLNVAMEEEQEKKWQKPTMWILPAIISASLFVIFLYVLKNLHSEQTNIKEIPPQEVGYSLFTTYLLGVEIVAMLLLAGIIGAYHLGSQRKKVQHRFLLKNNEN